MAEAIRSKDIAKEVLMRKLLAYLRKKEFKDKEELDKETQNITTEIKMLHNLNIIDLQVAQDTLLTVRTKYEAELKSERYKEWRESVAYFSVDGKMTDRDRLFMIRKAEKSELERSTKQTLTLAQWRDKIMNEVSESASGEIEDMNRNVNSEILKNPLKDADEEYTKSTGVFA